MAITERGLRGALTRARVDIAKITDYLSEHGHSFDRKEAQGIREWVDYIESRCGPMMPAKNPVKKRKVDPDALSEPMARAASKDGSLTLRYTVVVLPSRIDELCAEGECRWYETCPAPPCNWSQADFVEYAVKRRMRDAGEVS